uniref:Uncharacterized protein n=1 Tax=Rhizophora mucronata TaxID=61149 RepID=A0A2P2NEY8_RHIMU
MKCYECCNQTCTACYARLSEPWFLPFIEKATKLIGACNHGYINCDWIWISGG